MPFLCRKYRNCTGDPSVYFHNSSYDETICEKEGKKMLIILGLILMIVIVLVGGDRGAMSLIALAGNILCLSLAIWLYAVTRVSGYCRCRNFNFLYHFVLSKWDEY